MHSFRATINNRIDGLLGELSYPMYIVHLFIIRLAVEFKLMEFQSPRSTIGVVAVVILASLILRYAVEIPIDRRRQHIAGRASPSVVPISRAAVTVS